MKNIFQSQIIDKYSGQHGGRMPPAVAADSFGSGRRWSRAEMTQNPARRQGSGKRSDKSYARGGATFRPGTAMLISYLLPAFKISSLIMIGGILFFGYRALVSSHLFKLQQVNIAGASHVRNEEINNIVHKHAAGGVWYINIDAVREELEQMPWVRSAVVARVLPSDLRIRIIERTPEVVIRSSSGRLIWVDSDTVSLGVVDPNEQMPAFFITGWDEEASETARSANRERLLIYTKLSDFCRASECSERISEVNLADIKDVRVDLAGDDAGVEIKLGNEKFGVRLKSALEMLDRERATPHGRQITRLDASFDGRIIAGFTPTGLLKEAQLK